MKSTLFYNRMFRVAVLACLLVGIGGLAGAQSDGFPLYPTLFTPYEKTPLAAAAPDGGILLPLPFERIESRAYWDYTFPDRLDANATSLELDISCSHPAAIQSFVLYLKSGQTWLSAVVQTPSPERHTLSIPLTAFQSDDGTADSTLWKKATILRISPWKAASVDSALHIYSIRTRTDSIAVIRGGALTAAGQEWIAGQAADRVSRLLKKADILHTVVDDDISAKKLSAYHIVVLPHNPTLSDEHIDVLRRFVALPDRKVFVFYGSNPQLAELLEFQLMPYQHMPSGRDWKTVLFETNAIAGLPENMAHFTVNLLPIRAATNATTARVIAYWENMEGRKDSHLPAAAVSARGAWFSHTPPLATPNAVQWIQAVFAYLEPERIQPTYATQIAAQQQCAQDMAPMLAAAARRTNEIRGVWDVTTRGATPTGLSAAIPKLADAGINTLFVQLGAAGVAHYRNTGGIPSSDRAQQFSATLVPRAIQTARKNNVALHAWIYCWSVDGLPEWVIQGFKDENLLMKDVYGNTLPWLNPALPRNRRYVIKLLCHLAELGVDGIHLDYVRYPGNDGCYSEASRAEFERGNGPVDHWPADVLPGGTKARLYKKFQTQQITTFVEEASKALRKINPTIRISAAVFPLPTSAASVCQNWPQWLMADYIDFVTPMIYTEDAAQFADWLSQNIHAVPGKEGHIVAGLGVTGADTQLSACDTARQILISREQNVGGFSYFQLDINLISSILPYLRMVN